MRITDEKMKLERKKLQRVDSLDLLDYIKQSVEILMHMRQEEFENFNKNWDLQEKLRAKQELEEDSTEKEGSDKPSKKWSTPKNSRFMLKMKILNEQLLTPKRVEMGDDGTYEIPEDYEIHL